MTRTWTLSSRSGLAGAPAGEPCGVRPGQRSLIGVRRLLGWLAATLLAGIPASAQLRLNEALSLNRTGLTDDQGARPDWLELHNPTPRTVDLAGWSLSDDPARPRKWTLLEGTLGSGQFMVVYASGENRQPVAAVPLAPEAVEGLALWLRADALDSSDPASMRVAGTNRFVLRWRDLSGARRDASQSGSTRQPRWIATPRPAVRFDGTDDLLNLASAVGTNSFTLLAVVRPDAGHDVEEPATSGTGGTSGQRWLFGAAHGGDNGAGAGLSVGTNGVGVYEHGSGYMPARTTIARPILARPVVLGITYRERAATLSVGGNTLPEAPVSPRDPVRAPTELGAGAYGAYAGDVLEVVGYARALTAAERRGVEEFLALRYNLLLEAPYHANFRLDGDGDQLVLSAPDGRVADAWDLPRLPRDVSVGVPADGGPVRLLFAEPTPGQANSTPGATEFLLAPTFSAPPGFHPGTFTLSLASPDAGSELRYTLDGSDPGPHSSLYSEPILVTNRTSQPNLLSRIPTAPGWSAPVGQVFKGTVVRARAYRAGAIPSDVATATYFVHPSNQPRYAVPVVSLSTDARNFFDPAIGIYVVGDAPGGNYAQSGEAWERPVHVELFETNGTRVIAQESGVRMHGNTSFGFPIKALRLHPLNQRGSGPFRHRIFPDLPIDRFDRLLLRPSGHDHYLTMMRDGLMQNLVRELGLDMQGYRPAVVFLNGEYWGIHNLQEAFEKNYFPSHHPELAGTDVDYLEGYAPGAFAYEGDALHYHALVEFLRSHPISASNHFAWVQSRMEIDNFRDYKLAEIFYYRWDIANHRLWRPRTPDGRLRWILFDCDVGYGGFWSEPNPWTFDMLSAVLTPSGSLHGHNNDATVFLLSRLLEHPEFRRDFIHRAADLMNATLATPRMLEFIDRMSGEIAPLMPEHINRWRAPSSLAEWQRNVEALRTFARLRPAHQRNHFRRRFSLGDDVQVRLGVSDPAGGTLRCNTLELDPVRGPTPWQGVYFRGHPITVEARPKPGWRFAGWQELGGHDQPTLTLALTADVTLTAVFVPRNDLRIASSERLPNGRLRWTVQGLPDEEILLEDSVDLRVWSPSIRLRADARGAGDVTVDPGLVRRFFRLRTP